MADLYKILIAEKLGYCDSLYESIIGKKLGGYSWISTDYEETPYIYRAMPNMSHYYNREIMDAVVGGTVAWNQLCIVPYSETISGVTFERDADRKTISISGTASATVYKAFRDMDKSVIGHVYYVDRDTSNPDLILYNDNGGVSCNTNPRAIGKATSANYFYIRIANGANLDETITPQLTDLTLALGSTIADYVYSLEQSTAGSGVAWLKANFPKMFSQYNPYDSGSIQSVSGLVSHITKDSDDNVIGSYPLDSTVTLRGIPKLDNGKLYYDGDVYGADGSISRKYGVVDLGTLEWTTDVSNGFRAELSGVKNPTTASERQDGLVCAKYIPSSSVSLTDMTDKGMLKYGGEIFIKDTAFTDAQTFKTAMNGVMLVYELATPTTETAQPFTKTQNCDSGGAEEFVTSGIVSVGHKSKYAEK